MKPIKVMCPICGKEMVVESYGIKREVVRFIGGEVSVIGAPINYVDYTCGCGNKMLYKGYEDCWKKCDGKCKCKSCVNFQDVPYENHGQST